MLFSEREVAIFFVIHLFDDFEEATNHILKFLIRQFIACIGFGDVVL